MATTKKTAGKTAKRNSKPSLLSCFEESTLSINQLNDKITNYKAFVAFMVFAISRNTLDMPVTKVIDLFKEYINRLTQSPSDYNVDVVIDILILDAQRDIELGYSYGVYDKAIMKMNF